MNFDRTIKLGAQEWAYADAPVDTLRARELLSTIDVMAREHAQIHAMIGPIALPTQGDSIWIPAHACTRGELWASVMWTGAGTLEVRGGYDQPWVSVTAGVWTAPIRSAVVVRLESLDATSALRLVASIDLRGTGVGSGEIYATAWEAP